MPNQSAIEPQGDILSTASSVSFGFIEVATNRTGSVTVYFDKGDEIRVTQKFSDEQRSRIAGYTITVEKGLTLVSSPAELPVIGGEDIIAFANSVYTAKQIAPFGAGTSHVDTVADHLVWARGTLLDAAAEWAGKIYENFASLGAHLRFK